MPLSFVHTNGPQFGVSIIPHHNERKHEMDDELPLELRELMSTNIETTELDECFEHLNRVLEDLKTQLKFLEEGLKCYKERRMNELVDLRRKIIDAFDSLQ